MTGMETPYSANRGPEPSTAPAEIHLIHIADLHLGSPFAWIPEQAERLRAEQFDAFLSVVEHCERERMHLLLIAGDLFDTPDPDPALARRVADALGTLTVTRVFIAAGNHDPAGLLSPYRTLDWPAHVHLFRGPRETVEVPDLGVCVHGAGFESEVARQPLFDPGWTVRDPSGTLHVLVLHGELVSGAVETIYNPIPADRLAAAGFDYAALGHVHAGTPAASVGPDARLAYSGCLTGRGFDETGPRGTLAVSLRRRAASGRSGVSASFLPPPRPARLLYELSVDLSGCGTPDEAVEAVSQAMASAGGGDWPRCLYRVTLTGDRREDEPAPLDRILGRLRDRVFHLVLRDRTTAREDLDALALRHSLRGAFVRGIRQRQEAAGGDEATVRRLEAALRLGLQAARGEVSADAAD